MSVEAKSNATMQALLSAVRKEIDAALSDMQSIERWIQLLVPKVEDGNNFGVSFAP